MQQWPDEGLLCDRLELAARRALDNKRIALFDSRWYDRQFEWLHHLMDLLELYETTDLNRVAAVVAALSPQVSWQSQVTHIPGVLYALSNGVLSIEGLHHPGFDRNKLVALDAWQRAEEALSGPKVLSFYRNLIGDEYAVTVDSQILDVATGSSPRTRPNLTVRRYEQIANAIRGVAASLPGGLTPARMQAMIWGWHRRENRGRID